MISKKSFYIFIVACSISGYSYIVGAQLADEVSVVEANAQGHSQLDDDLDFFLDDLMRGDVEVDEIEIKPISRMQLIARYLGGPVSIVYIKLYGYASFLKLWTAKTWNALKFKLTWSNH